MNTFPITDVLSPQFVFLGGYLLGINLVTFFFFGIDKFQATSGGRRIRERTLWILAALGGSGGALLGMHIFRHKTKKASFQALLAVILATHIVLILFLFL